MKPIFKIKINREELTQAVIDRVTSIKVEDAAGYENDNLVIEIDGRAPFPKFPKAGAIAEVSFGYAEMENVITKIPLSKMGTYELADMDWDGAPWALTLNFNAMSMLKFPKTARNDTHEDTNLKELVEKLGKRMGYKVDVHSSFADVDLPFEQQKNQTDMEFIAFLAQRHGAFPKVLNQTLRFAPKDGANFVDQYIFLEDILPGSLNYHSQVRGVYSAIQAATFSFDTGELERVEVEATDVQADPEFIGPQPPKTIMELSRLYDTQEKARAAATSKRSFLAASEETLSFKVGGNPLMQSHRKLELNGEGWHPDIPKKWIIVSSTHHWKKGSDGEAGYTTQVKCEVLTKGKADADNADSGLPNSTIE